MTRVALQRALDEISRVERKGVRASRVISAKVRRRVLQQMLNGFTPNVHEIITQALLATTRDAMLVTHLLGIKREREVFEQQGLKLSVFDSTLSQLAKRLDIDLKLLRSKYGVQALRVLTDSSLRVERELQDVVGGLVRQGANVGEGKKQLADAFDRLGLTPKNSYTLENIFRTQTQLAYNAGKWEADQDPDIQEILWGYEYVTVGDDRVRPSHAALDGVTLPKDDPMWESIWPPNGWSCRCAVIPIFEEQDVVQPGADFDGPDEGWDFNPGRVFATGTRLSLAFDPDQPRDAHGRFGSGGGSSKQPKGAASSKEHAEAKRIADEKIAAAPVPSAEAVRKAREELEAARRGEGRAGGEARGGSAASRRKQRENLFKEFGGDRRGYVVCPHTGIKMHWTDDKRVNPKGYPKFERGKIFVKSQGGGYQLPNLIPESFTANRSRGATPLRKENLELGFDPNQPRDDHGKFGEKGGGSSKKFKEVIVGNGVDLEFAEKVPALVGAQDGSIIKMTAIGNDNTMIGVKITHDKYEATRIIHTQDKFIENISFTAREQGTGLGTKIFSEQVEAASAEGFEKINTVAAGAGDATGAMNGYYTWPRLGYDGALDLGAGYEPNGIDRKKAREVVPGATRVSDMMRTPEGRAWWKANGREVAVSFDLKDGSLSRKVLDAYNEERKKR